MSAGAAAAQLAAGPVAGVAARYAEALFELALEEGALEAIEVDVAALRAAVAESEDLRVFLKNPVYGVEEQTRAMAALAEKAGFAPLMRNFLALVAKNRRLFALPAILAAFAARLAAHRGEVAADAIAAVPLNDEQIKRLRHELEAMVGRAVNLSVRVDPELLGGLVVKVGSTMIDSSLKTKLNRLKSVMKEA
ncbi:F0F1 ATP synthase subunit delta [Amphiplicatus metriothermophilus]|uniref:ATP synthase subunit delta n=1 Tax=Amphiplicatus metriothermophilus TaxID=1519374 RepID=A0A239PJH0_9PROT|nr:F0F1 ATP synthase subunit delta [Amphiplicatus metriothermophilus]MBB5517889.1 F-type H+-transporting ATPase subunit delta [Amphiplicatus metriothermophilus]SNT67777.1 ATP synthase F1 subcomplex delta subunit [Amphiplicatus metriothermophilus]